jgi:hypothetical protein
MQNITVTNVETHEDGSATCSFDIPQELSTVLAVLGLELLLHCAAVGISSKQALKLIDNYVSESESC